MPSLESIRQKLRAGKAPAAIPSLVAASSTETYLASAHSNWRDSHKMIYRIEGSMSIDRQGGASLVFAQGSLITRTGHNNDGEIVGLMEEWLVLSVNRRRLIAREIIADMKGPGVFPSPPLAQVDAMVRTITSLAKKYDKMKPNLLKAPKAPGEDTPNVKS